MLGVHTHSSEEQKSSTDGVGLNIQAEWRQTWKALEAKTPGKESVIQLLHDAAKRDDVSIVTSLVRDSHVNPNSRDRKGWTALLRATKTDSRKVLEWLIMCKADLNTQTKELNSALHKAAKRCRPEAAEMLCAAGADPNLKNKGGATPLMLAVMHRSAEDVVKVLLRHKLDLNAQKDVGYTALMLAARMGNSFAVGALIKAKAELEVKDKQGETALTKAHKHHKDEVCQMLMQSGARPQKGYNFSGGAAPKQLKP
mmetsp:Transcript_120617/g.257602  ORF Transcript_120617/g.257602 Transcript_120617/m.257602 type:complete len:255 (-) Transcript_120617:68-832(-)